jgi:MoxR-like ATPase
MLAEKRKEACRLYIAGETLDAIAVRMGYATRSGAWRAIQRGIDQIPAPEAKQAKGIALDRARWAYSKAREAVEASSIAKDDEGKPVPGLTQGADPRALSALLAAQEHLAKLEGTYAPTKVQEVAPERLSAEQLATELEAEARKMREQLAEAN